MLIGSGPRLNSLLRPPANRHGPLVGTAGFPVRRHEGRARHRPAMAEIVVHEWLEQHLVHVLLVPARERPLIVDERTNHPGALHRQRHRRGPDAVHAAAQLGVGRASSVSSPLDWGSAGAAGAATMPSTAISQAILNRVSIVARDARERRAAAVSDLGPIAFCMYRLRASSAYTVTYA